VTLDDDMRAVIESSHLCFAATVTPDGRPNVSPKGTIRVLDDTHVCFLDIASPNTRANLATNPWMEVNVVEPLSRRGYRFRGRARVHVDDAVARGVLARILAEEGSTFGARAVIVLDVEEARPLISPGYRTTPDELAMRAMHRERRAAADAVFDAHVVRRGPYRP
jgi:predicted pyridoxine 5'-phosphate oxidase superfamily flavin-nucleotide-binding protein